MRLLYWLRRLFGLLPPARWEDGVVVQDPLYEQVYAKTVEWVRVVSPESVQSPEFRLTVRLYDRFPPECAYTLGKVLAPHTIPGDTGGTLCLLRQTRHDMALIVHECKHAVTGIPSHPAWLFN